MKGMAVECAGVENKLNRQGGLQLGLISSTGAAG